MCNYPPFITHSSLLSSFQSHVVFAPLTSDPFRSLYICLILSISVLYAIITRSSNIPTIFQVFGRTLSLLLFCLTLSVPYTRVSTFPSLFRMWLFYIFGSSFVSHSTVRSFSCPMVSLPPPSSTLSIPYVFESFHHYFPCDYTPFSESVVFDPHSSAKPPHCPTSFSHSFQFPAPFAPTILRLPSLLALPLSAPHPPSSLPSQNPLYFNLQVLKATSRFSRL